MKKSFYYVDANYIQYLKEIEINKRGFTTVPNVEYHTHNKFVYGMVMEIDGAEYYVPIPLYRKIVACF